MAGAGIHRIGIVDGDVVEEHNLHRQILHSSETIGSLKVDSARQRLELLNPLVEVETFPTYLTAENAIEIISSYDLVRVSVVRHR